MNSFSVRCSLNSSYHVMLAQISGTVSHLPFVKPHQPVLSNNCSQPICFYFKSKLVFMFIFICFAYCWLPWAPLRDWIVRYIRSLTIIITSNIINVGWHNVISLLFILSLLFCVIFLVAPPPSIDPTTWSIHARFDCHYWRDCDYRQVKFFDRESFLLICLIIINKYFNKT